MNGNNIQNPLQTNSQKPKFEFLNINKIKKGPLKLLKVPKNINTSNGGHTGKLNFNILNNNMQYNTNFTKENQLTSYKEFKLGDNKTNEFRNILLNNPKIKFPRKLMRNTASPNENFLDSTAITNGTAGNTENKKKDHSTTIVLEEVEIKPYLGENYKKKEKFEKFEKNEKNEKFEKVSNFHKLKQIKSSSQMNTINTDNLSNNFQNYPNKTHHINKHRTLVAEVDETPSGSFNNETNQEYFLNRSSHIRNSRSHTKMRLKETTLPVRQKSFIHRKQGIQIIDEIIKGLTKLKTIIADEEIEADHDIEGLIRNSTNLFTKKTIDTTNDNMLISSTTGEQIQVENRRIFNMMKNKTINQKTIEPEESTIKQDEESNANNDSLMMQIKTEEKNKSLLANRYSEQENYQKIKNNSKNEKNENFLKNPKSKKIKIQTNDSYSCNNYNNFRGENSNTNSYTPNLKIAKPKIRVENESYILEQNNLSSNNMSIKYPERFSNYTPNNHFTIDKFEYKVVNNKNTINSSVSTSHKRSGSNFHIYNQNMRKKENPKKLRDLTMNLEVNARRTIKIDDEFANYEFID